MTLQEASNIIDVVCTNYKGTRQEHQMIQQALQTINMSLIKPKTVESKVVNERSSNYVEDKPEAD